jgi:hypothetical protein
MTAFVITDASVISANHTGQESDRYLALIADKNVYAKSIRCISTFLVLFILGNADGTKIRITFHISFGEIIFQLNTSVIPWLMQLKAAINNGISDL